MSIKVLFRSSDMAVLVDRVGSPLTNESNVADATVSVSLYDEFGVVVPGASGIAAPWNSNVGQYVAVLPDTMTLVELASYEAQVTIVRGSSKRVVTMECVAQDGL